MNTEHLFGLYWARARMPDARQERSAPADTPESGGNQAGRHTAAEREAACERLFDAIRQAVRDSDHRP